MPAISDKVLDCMSTNLNIHLENYLRLHPISLTHDEYLDLLAKPEHHSILRDAAKYADISSSERWVQCKAPVDGLGLSDNSIHLGFYARSEAGRDAPLIPRYIKWHGNAPAAPKVAEWLAWRIETGKKAALVNWLLSNFKAWDSGSKVRFVWPAVMQLCAPLNAAYTSNADKLEAWAKRYSAYKALGPRFELVGVRSIGRVEGRAQLHDGRPHKSYFASAVPRFEIVQEPVDQRGLLAGLEVPRQPLGYLGAAGALPSMTRDQRRVPPASLRACQSPRCILLSLRPKPSTGALHCTQRSDEEMSAYLSRRILWCSGLASRSRYSSWVPLMGCSLR